MPACVRACVRVYVQARVCVRVWKHVCVCVTVCLFLCFAIFTDYFISNFIFHCYFTVNLIFFFLFRLFPSGVATADFPSPVVPIFCILLRHFNLGHVLFRHIHKPPFWPFSFPLSWQLHPQHPSPNTSIIFPPYMTILPPQSCLSCFLSKPSYLCCPSDVLIPDFVHSCHITPINKIVTPSTMPPSSPPPVFLSVPPSPTRTTLLVSLPPCTPSLSL